MNVAAPTSTPASLTLTPRADSVPFHSVDCTSRCVMDGLIRTAADRCEATVAPLPWTKCGLSDNGESTTTHRMERSQFMDGALCCFHSHGLMQTEISKGVL